ncbi:phosphogluconate dehydratase [Zobellella denitrificans]|uniref:phosphogluconate dehydratase n=1 Tax=Zobellella denitrificans TaxID=347534 RepID=UPI000B8BD0B6|nr:phosphogluconate dehydratase [Zobellella denitrificans]OXS13931.1 phosphogluconate dehydratase [Zobellella denitrificans]
MHPILDRVTARIRARSQTSRDTYQRRMEHQAAQGKTRAGLACGNLAHVVAAACPSQKARLLDMTRANLAIVTAYNDMLSAHQPYQAYPDAIKAALAERGHSAQVAGGVPAMCDGITQGRPGMELSLLSRDLIAQATAVSLSHDAFDATLLLGICDKIAPGQLIGALSFGQLPTAFIPAGPMATGIGNEDKVRVRQQYAAGQVGREALQEMENRAYHSPGTCTFYGTANSNQLVFEAMGLMLPGSAFVAPDSPLRHALTTEAAMRLAAQATGVASRPLYRVLDEKAVVNGVVALLASGGSSNHTLHLVAIARAAGWVLNWDDFDELSAAVPLLARIYPNGPADINAFQQAGGVPLLLHRLAERGLLHTNALPVYGDYQDHFSAPALTVDGRLHWRPCADTRDPTVIASRDQPFSASGGLKVLDGNLGRAIIKVSAVAPEHRRIRAPARVFDSQQAVVDAYRAGELQRDGVIVGRFNGPAANGMPELHQLMPLLGNLQQAGHRVALVTDGRLSGASGKIPAALHLTPEAARGGPLARLCDGDLITLDAERGTLTVDAPLQERPSATPDLSDNDAGCGRELFAPLRAQVSDAEHGASLFSPPAPARPARSQEEEPR